MYGSHAHIPSYHPSGVTGLTHFSSEDVTLWMRQQPKEALLCVDGKEKVRKPVDPPPIVQLTMTTRSDPPQHFLQSPYLFMCASLWLPDRDEPWKGAPTKSLAGSMVSSLHRLKDIDNKDGAFFVFGDISVKVRGRFRLRFSLFDYQKSTNAAHYLGAVTSLPFTVDLQKDYKGLTESTYLSRAFSDQGVRLRLRKEPRTVIGSKRSYASVAPPPPESPNKRPRVSDDESHEEVSYAPSLPSTYNSLPSMSSTYNTTPTMSSAYNMGPAMSSTYSMAAYPSSDILAPQHLSQQQWPTPQSFSHWYDNGQVP